MAAITINQYQTLTLTELLEQLSVEWYDTILAACTKTRLHLTNLLKLEVNEPSQYLQQCDSLLQETEQYIASRKERFTPYINSLAEKAATKHDCANCTGNCKLNHDMQLWELRNSNRGIKDILNGLQMLSLPLHSDTMYPDAYRVLRNHVSLLESDLAKLFLIEESFLIPKVIEAQKLINAGSH